MESALPRARRVSPVVRASVHIQRLGRRPSDRRPTDQFSPSLAPAEVPFPNVRARVIEWHPFASARVSRLCAIAFRNVAVGAGQAQVLGGRLTTSRMRSDVIKMKCLPDEDLWRVAILTPPCCPCFHACSQPSRDPSSHPRTCSRLGSARLKDDSLRTCRKRCFIGLPRSSNSSGRRARAKA